MEAPAPSPQDSSVQEIYLEASYPYACAGRAISSDGQREYRLSLVSIKRNEPQGIEDELRVSCNCKGFRMKGKEDCPHWEGLVVEWAAALRRQGAAKRGRKPSVQGIPWGPDHPAYDEMGQ